MTLTGEVSSATVDDIHLERKRFTGTGVEVRPGARDRHHSNLEKLSFSFWVVCDSVDPSAGTAR